MLPLTNLLRGGYVAKKYIPPSEVVKLKKLVRPRPSLVRARVTIKNKVHTKLLM